MKLFLDEKGVALPLVLMILFILTLLGTTIFMFNMAETKQVALTEEQMKAHYVARSGAHAVAAYLVDNPLSAGDLLDSPKVVGHEFGEGQFDIEVYGGQDEVHVLSTGRVGDTERSVIVTLADRDIDFPLYGNNITVSGGAGSITGGDVYYGETTNLYDHAESVLDEGAELVNEKIDFGPVILPCNDETLGIFYGICNDAGWQVKNIEDEVEQREVIVDYDKDEDKQKTEIKDVYMITEHGEYTDISLSGNTPDYLKIEAANDNDLLLKANSIDLGNNRLTVTLNDNTVAIVVDDFSAGGNSNIYLWGSGRLMLYVDNYSGSGNFNYDPAPDSDIIFNVFVSKNGVFDMSGTPNFTGTIYAPEAQSVLAGNSSLNGWIITDNFEGDGNFELNYVPMEMAGTSMDFINYRIQKWLYDE